MSQSNIIGSGQPGDFPDVNSLTYEQARAELQEITMILERGNMPLHEALEYWDRGQELVAYCEKQLSQARHRIDSALKASQSESSNDQEAEE